MLRPYEGDCLQRLQHGSVVEMVILSRALETVDGLGEDGGNWYYQNSCLSTSGHADRLR